MAQVTNYLQNTEAARQKTLQLAQASETASAKFERQNAAMRDVGVRMTAFGAVALAATGLAVKAAIDWQSAWTGVTKTVDGSAEEMAALEDQLRSLTGVLPATHEEIAGVAEAAGQLGVAREDVAAFTKTMIDLSETTNLSADEAATSIAQLMNVMQTAPDDVDNLGAALVALGNDGASTERDIVQMAQRIAGAGKIVGLTEAQVLGFANALASVGIDAEAGGSAVSRIMTDIAKSVSAGGDQLDRFAKVAGMSSKEFQKAFKEDPADAIATFVEGLARIDKEGGDVFTTLSDLGQSDIRVSNALLGMANSGDLLRKSLQLGSAAWKENTALLEEATKRYGTAEAKIQIAGNSIRDAAIDWGSVFLPAVSAVAEVVADAAQGFAALPAPIQATVAVTVALAGAAALAGGAFLLGVPAVAQFNAQLAILRASELPGVATAATAATTAVGKTTAGLSAAARFLMGPWGLALAAAAVGTLALKQALEAMQATAEEMENSVRLAADANEILATAFKGAPDGFWFDDGARSIDKFQHRLELLATMDSNLWEKLLPGNQAETSDFAVGLDKVGKTLAKLASTDVPAALSAFQLLADKTDGSDLQMRQLLKSMGPEFEAVLQRMATEQGIATEGMSDAERAQVLLNLAMEGAEDPAETAAGAYKAAADKASELDSNLRMLIDAVNAANGVGQDAVSANIAYQDALAGVDEVIQKAREGVEGYALTLDTNTQAGRDNMGMLNDLAGDYQAAAAAQFALDGNTQNYVANLQAGRDAVLQRARDLGATDEQIQYLSEHIVAMPNDKEIKIIAETAAAARTIDDFMDTYGNLVGRIMYRATLPDLNGDVSGNGRPGFAAGGAVRGPGGPRSDLILAMLSNGEHIWTAAEVQAAGGHAGVEAMRQEVLGGRSAITGYARGGMVGEPQYASNHGPGSTVVVQAPAVQMPSSLNVYDVNGKLLGAMKVVVKDELNQVAKSARMGGGRG